MRFIQINIFYCQIGGSNVVAQSSRAVAFGPRSHAPRCFAVAARAALAAARVCVCDGFGEFDEIAAGATAWFQHVSGFAMRSCK